LYFIDIPESEQYETAIPLLNLKAAAGDFSMEQYIEVCDWVRLPEPFQHKSGYFVVQVLGESMNRRIPNGAWCLFKSDQGGSRQNKIVLVKSSDIQDPEIGGCFTVKKYSSEKEGGDDDTWLHKKIVLEPMTTIEGFNKIELSEEQIESFEVIGEFIAVI
jgi:SOS-response transcriptional repressor LexA